MKHIIITGPQGSGKTTKLKEILAQFDKDQVLTYTTMNLITYKIWDKYHLLVLQATTNTKCMVIEEVNNLYTAIHFALNTQLFTREHSGNVTELKPQLIFVSQLPVPDLYANSATFNKLFTVINLNN